MSRANITSFFLGLLIGILATYSVISYNSNTANVQSVSPLPPEQIELNCDESVIREKFTEYANFYINDADWFWS